MRLSLSSQGAKQLKYAIPNSKTALGTYTYAESFDLFIDTNSNEMDRPGEQFLYSCLSSGVPEIVLVAKWIQGWIQRHHLLFTCYFLGSWGVPETLLVAKWIQGWTPEA